LTGLVRSSRHELRPSAVVLLIATLSACATLDRDQTWLANQLSERTGAAPRSTDEDEASLPPGISTEDGVTEDEAVATALWRNAAFAEALASLGFARADVLQAGLLSNPVFSILFPLGAKQLEFTLKLPAEALLLRPKRLAVARAEADRIAERLVQSGLDVVRDVRVGWAEARRAGDKARLAAEAVRLRERIESITDAQRAAGDASTIDVATARADVVLAREESARLDGERRVVEARLRVLIGLTSGDVVLRFDDVASGLGTDVTSDEVLRASALAARPDVRAAELAVDAAIARRSLSRWEVVSFSGIADANGKGTNGFEIGPGLDVTLPVLNWNQGGMARADAEEVRARRQLDAVRQRVELEVTEAHVRLLAAGAALAALRADALTELERAEDAATAGYRAGDVSLLMLLQTTGQLLTARRREVDAVADVARAHAELERNVGHRLDVTLSSARLR